MTAPERENGERRTQAPALSVVVASQGGGAELERCLAGLREQARSCGAELIVVHAGEAPVVASAHPNVRLVACETSATAAELRAAGMRAAGGDIVALLDADVVPAADWLAHLVERYRSAGQG